MCSEQIQSVSFIRQIASPGFQGKKPLLRFLGIRYTSGDYSCWNSFCLKQTALDRFVKLHNYGVRKDHLANEMYSPAKHRNSN